MRIIVATLIAVSFLTACSKPEDTVIPMDPSTWEEKLKPAIAKLSEDDRKLLAGFLMRTKVSEIMKNGDGIEIGTTVKTALDKQRAFIAERERIEQEQAALKERVERDRAAAQAQAEKMLTVTVLKLSVEKIDYSDYQTFRVALANKGDKDIAGVKGCVNFVDMFSTPSGAVCFSIDDSIDIGKTLIWNGQRRYNQFEDTHRKLAGLTEGKYTTVFEPEMVIFRDGSKLDAKNWK